ncbi:alpha/beta hydrolase [Brevundimonas subvibrioides]|uniref:Esterase/lipase n=1 Tax=Brevundimonas subvibrioides (strain ATCC 15264 / DSM 4735 / LMG 14903 / NBRC 16000 / CB 81) TaxID=633149 RepID=D9QGD4_BRESC|nr:alpha/beta hydrolase [Brevundimonas subvibrioides]ADL00750.1 esterase/lipase [Brevundimonas subvibrioides ATCC 15264]
MTLDRRTLLGVAALASAAPALTPVSASAAAQIPAVAPPDPTEVVQLWPNGAPGGENVTVTAIVPERSTDPAFHDRFAQYTTDPILTVMRPERPNGAALLLIPGGGYRWAVVDKEGMDVARVFAAAGVTCFVLRYRLPADGWTAGPDAPLQDAQRALRLIRANAADYGIDPDRIASLGASAGGHLAGLLAARRDATYAPVDAADAASFRPDLNVLLYPVATMADPFVHAGSREQLLGPTPTPEQIAAWSLERMDWTGVGPTVLIHAIDDPAVVVENSLNLLATLRTARVTSEAHLFQEGGHGFGIRLISGRPAAVWPDLVRAFGARNGWLSA